MTATENAAITTYEFTGKDDYGRSARTIYATRPEVGYGQVAVITVLPKAWRDTHPGEGFHIVTDRRREMPYSPNFLRDRVRTVKGLKAARELAETIAQLPVGQPI